MNRVGFRIAAATLSLLATGGVGPAQTESPFVATLRQGDPGRTGFVTREQVEAPARAVVALQEAKASAAWNGLLLFMGLPNSAETVEVKAMAEVLRQRIREADADGDGKTTRAEIEAYASKEQTPESKAGVTERLASLDADGDGVVSAEERRVELDEEQTKQPLSLATSLQRAEALGLWQIRSIDRIFQAYAAPDGRLDIEDVARRLKDLSAKKKP